MNEKKKEDMICAASFAPLGFLMGGPSGLIISGIATALVGKINDYEVEREKKYHETVVSEAKRKSLEKYILQNGTPEEAAEQSKRLFDELRSISIENPIQILIEPGIIGMDAGNFIKEIGFPKVDYDMYPVIGYQRYPYEWPKKVLFQGYLCKHKSFSNKLKSLKYNSNFKAEHLHIYYQNLNISQPHYGITIDGKTYYLW